ncbi:S1 family peptidase [Streptomyces sp. NPDC002004]
MRRARRGRGRFVRLAAVGGLLCGGLMVTSAMAVEPAPGTQAGGGAVRPVDLGGRLVSQLGPTRTGGSWIGADGRPVVAVTDSDAATRVERAGARAKVVRISLRRLRSATDALAAAPRVPGTAWAVDYATNRVMVQADSTVSSGDWSRMSHLAGRLGGFVHMQRTPGSLSTRLAGGAPVFARDGRCSAGFDVTDGRRSFILTAGHCGPRGTVWFKDAEGAETLGTTVADDFPGTDFSLIAYANGAADGADTVVDVGGGRGVRMTAVADPVVGQEVFRSGSTTGVHSGRVTALNATVNYPEGTVTGLIATTVCAEPGDSGGPLFARNAALGVTSGGNGDCTKGGVTYFQPATKAMEALGVRLAGAGADGAGGGAGTGPARAASGAVAPQPVDSLSLEGVFGPWTLPTGLAVIAVSLAALVAGRWIRSAQDRRSYRREYSRVWG